MTETTGFSKVSEVATFDGSSQTSNDYLIVAEITTNVQKKETVHFLLATNDYKTKDDFYIWFLRFVDFLEYLIVAYLAAAVHVHF
jgi:hypothetical protein